MNFFDFLTDPILRGPMWGSLFMSLATSLIGVVVQLQRRSLLGEAMSHSSFPGVVLGLMVAILLGFNPMAGILCGAFFAALLGQRVLNYLEEKVRVKSDAALCFVLATFFGFGLLLFSRMQITHALHSKHIQTFLYGQAATMVDEHAFLFAILGTLVLSALILIFRPLHALLFDRTFSKSVGISVKRVDQVISLLLALAIVIGIRSVGVVLISGMLIAPAVAARALARTLRTFFFLAAFFGVLSGALGNYFSVMIPIWFQGEGAFSLPTGPMIVLVAACFAFANLLFARERGVVVRAWRLSAFQRRCRVENLLKKLWREGKKGGSALPTSFALRRLIREGWGERRGKRVFLTRDGEKKAAHLIRLHRLWEAYLVRMGHGSDKVHRSAEEMEHILTPAIEKELAEFLGDPKKDPHGSPIPDGEVLT